MKTEGYEYQSEWMRQSFDEGKAEGKAEVVRALCEAHGLGWDALRASVVARLSGADLERLVVRISAERRWPEDA
jgi:hypothetical protein